MRYLVIANQTLGGRLLIETVSARAREGATIHVTVPATAPEAEDSASGATAESVAEARLEEELRRLEDAKVQATGNVGGADPLQAIRDQWTQASYSGLIISTLPKTVSRWLHLDLPHRAVREFGVPVEWIEAADDDTDGGSVQILLPSQVGPNMSNEDQIPPLRTH